MAVGAQSRYTFLFTDIEGSTRLWEAQPERMAAALARHDALLRAAMESRGGHVFKTVGDAFCVAFTAPDAALEAALDVQRSLVAEPWDEATPIRVRMALHTGPAEARDGDYFGRTLNRCARILGLAAGGQVLASEATAAAAAPGAADGALLDPAGTHRLRDLDRPIGLFVLRHPDLPADHPPLRSLDTLPTNLPEVSGALVGRADELRAVRAELERARVVTLVGPGGIGKTRLALAVAVDCLDEHPDGVWFVDLAPLTDAAVVDDALARVLGLREQPGRPLRATLCDWLRARRTVLLVDNCEHLIDACAALVAAVVAASPGTRVLATSREPLHVAGERPWPVAPLAAPMAEAAAPTADVAAGFPAVALFVERAAAARPDFVLTDADVPAVAALCRRLDGIPLALELAAARVRVLSPAAILERLDDRFRLVAGGRRDVLPRQQTLRALIDWSFDLLEPAERTLLARLATFRGGWELGAAEAVCADGSLDVYEILDGLSRLVDKSLVTRLGDADGGRFGLLESIRAYALEKRAASGDEAAMDAAHRAWCLALAAEAAEGLRGADQAVWLARLDREHANLRAALDRALGSPAGSTEAALRANGAPATPAATRPALDPVAVSEAVALAARLWRFWYVRGHLGEGRQRLAAARAAADAVGAALDGTVLAEALHGEATLAGEQGDFEAARALHQESLGLRRAAGDVAGEAASLNNLAMIAYGQGDLMAARDLYEASLAHKRALGDRRGIANTLGNLALIAMQRAEFAAATDSYSECVAIWRALGDVRSLANTMLNRAAVVADRGDFAAADVDLAEGLALFQALGDGPGAATARYMAADAAFCRGDLAAARDGFEEALAAERALGNVAGEARCLARLGRIAVHEGRPDEARAALEASRGHMEAMGNRRGLAEALDGLGLVALCAGDLDGARAALARSLVLSHAMDGKVAALYAIERLAVVAVAASDPARALRLLGAADAARAALGAPVAPVDVADFERTRAAAWDALAPEDARAAWASGKALDLPAAVALAVAG